jgi:hypothetical protein
MNRLIYTAEGWQLDIFVRGLRVKAVTDLMNRNLYCVTYDYCMLVSLDRPKRRDCCGCEHRLPLCSNEEAALWISQELGLLVFNIVCGILVIALCWYWQFLLTVGGNLLSHMVTPLDVTTIAWCVRQTQDILHSVECPPAALQTSQWQWTASVFTAW